MATTAQLVQCLSLHWLCSADDLRRGQSSRHCSWRTRASFIWIIVLTAPTFAPTILGAEAARFLLTSRLRAIKSDLINVPKISLTDFIIGPIDRLVVPINFPPEFMTAVYTGPLLSWCRLMFETCCPALQLGRTAKYNHQQNTVQFHGSPISMSAFTRS